MEATSEILHGDEPGRKGYRRHGCRCAECRADWNAYCKERAAARKNPSSVTRLRSVAGGGASQATRTQNEPGENEAAVIEQLAPYIEDEPALVMGARAMARILDSNRISDHARAMHELNSTIDRLKSGAKKKSRGRLAVVQGMTKRAGGGG